ncbi:MAG: hypothetical protein VKJ24_21825 [Synechococcales bacterium]|nr:hypothetical protein [Synechococcales bacterium]
MGDITLKGRLNLKGNLTLKDKVKIGSQEALVEVIAPADAPQGNSAPPVIIPPPPAGPSDPAPTVWIINSFNKTVKAKTKPIVALGMVMQGNTPTWPGIMMPSQGNTGPVTINFIPINVVNDQATILPSGGTATFTSSGQV